MILIAYIMNFFNQILIYHSGQFVHSVRNPLENPAKKAEKGLDNASNPLILIGSEACYSAIHHLLGSLLVRCWSLPKKGRGFDLKE